MVTTAVDNKSTHHVRDRRLAAERTAEQKKKPEAQAPQPPPAADSAPADPNRAPPTLKTRLETRDRVLRDASNMFRQAQTAGKLDARATPAQDVKGPTPSEVTRNPSDVNRNTPEEVEAAKKEFEANKQAEEQKHAALGTTERASYDKVAGTVGEDPVARRALQDMLIKGRFDDQEGKDTLNELGKVSEQKLADGIERGPLVADMVQELQDPSAIAQHGYGTCVATTGAIHLAKNDPSEYVRLVGGLASPEGEIKLKNGDTLKRENGTIDEDKSNPGAERTQSVRLLSASFMEYAREGADYDPHQDRHETHLGPIELDRGRGLNIGAYDHLMEGITGRQFDSHEVDGDDAKKELDRIATATGRGEQVAIALQWDKDAGHQVLVTRVDKDNVYYINPWGQEEKLSRAETEKRLTAASYAA